jgi:hypothetical protein
MAKQTLTLKPFGGASNSPPGSTVPPGTEIHALGGPLAAVRHLLTKLTESELEQVLVDVAA